MTHLRQVPQLYRGVAAARGERRAPAPAAAAPGVPPAAGLNREHRAAPRVLAAVRLDAARGECEGGWRERAEAHVFELRRRA